jgi:hypothetical protein
MAGRWRIEVEKWWNKGEERGVEVVELERLKWLGRLTRIFGFGKLKKARNLKTWKITV